MFLYFRSIHKISTLRTSRNILFIYPILHPHRLFSKLIRGYDFNEDNLAVEGLGATKFLSPNSAVTINADNPDIHSPSALALKFKQLFNPSCNSTSQHRSKRSPEKEIDDLTNAGLISPEIYMRMRRIHIDRIRSCPPATAMHILWTISSTSSPSSSLYSNMPSKHKIIVTTTVIHDIIWNHSLDDSQRRQIITDIILKIHFSAISYSSVQRMVHYLFSTSEGREIVIGKPKLKNPKDRFTSTQHQSSLPETRGGILTALVRKLALECLPSSPEVPEDAEAELRLLTGLHPFLLQKLQQNEERGPGNESPAGHNTRTRLQSGSKISIYVPPKIMSTAFSWIEKLITVQRQYQDLPHPRDGYLILDEKALEMFQGLVEMGFVPQEILDSVHQTMPKTSQDASGFSSEESFTSLSNSDQFSLVILIALSLSAMKWERPPLALHILSTLLDLFISKTPPIDTPPSIGPLYTAESPPNPDAYNDWLPSHLHALAVDQIGETVRNNPLPLDLLMAGNLIRSLHRITFSRYHTKDPPIPPNLLQKFYLEATNLRHFTARVATSKGAKFEDLSMTKNMSAYNVALGAARDLYIFTRTPEVGAQCYYEPPNGRSALVILEGLLTPSLRGVTFSDEVVSLGSTIRQVRLPPSGQTEQVLQNLDHNGWHHRTLPTMYMQYARMLATEAAESKIYFPWNDRAKFIALCSRSGFAGPARRLWERYANDPIGGEYIRGNASCMLRLVQSNEYLARRTQGELQASLEKAPYELEDTVQRRNKASDFRMFASKVIDAFMKCHSPLDKSSHYTLTTLARAKFIMGDHIAGFDTLKLIMKREDMQLDMADLNVALSYVAEFSPSSAARLVEVMIEKGLTPDKYTIGTIVHWALLWGDTRLAEDFLARIEGVAVDSEGKQVTLDGTGFASVIRSMTNPELPLTGKYSDSGIEGDQRERRERLEAAMEILETLNDSEKVMTSHMGRHLVFASLKHKEPLMAFKFWRMLLKYNEDWFDREQMFLRRLIASQLEKRTSLENSYGGIVDARQRAGMILELKELV